MAQDDGFQEIKVCKRHISEGTSQKSKMLTTPVPTSAAVMLLPKAVVICNLFAALRTTDMDTDITGAENTLPEQEAFRKTGGPPPIVMTSITDLT
jgi:hypothetical protein